MLLSEPEKRLYIILKYLLALVAFVFATSLSLVILWYSSAATDTGTTPASAISLTNHVNTGVLASDQERWFRIVPSKLGSTAQVEQSLLLASTPRHLSQNVLLQIFEEDQLAQFEQNSLQVSSYGIGRWTDELDDQPTGVMWSGLIDNSKIYYVRVVNNNENRVDYWLFASQPNQIEPSQVQSAPATSSPMLVSEVGRQPHLAIDLLPGTNQGRLPADSVSWYTFTQNDLSQSSHFQDLIFTFFFTPGDGNRRHHVNFQLYTAQEVEAWQRGLSRLNNFGAGMLVARDSDPRTGERIWRGNLLRGSKYYLAIENGSDVDIDFWLYDQDISNPQLGSNEN